MHTHTITINTKGINLLRHILTTSGKVMERNNRNFWEPRRLNGMESSQRRHFFKKTDVILSVNNDLSDELRSKHKEKIDKLRDEFKQKNPTKEAEPKALYDKRINFEVMNSKEAREGLDELNAELEKIDNAVYRIDLEDNTFDFIKKYYNEYGETAGFEEKDDESVCNLNTYFL